MTNYKSHAAKYGMVTSASKQASDAGLQILKQGGNAFDAAAGVSYALGVSEPQASGMGGQSTGLLYIAKEKRYIALDGSSYAPYHIQPSAMPKGPLKEGLSASTLPSTVAFYGYLVDAYGTKPLNVILAPAIKLAQEGSLMTPLIHSLILKHEKSLKKDETIVRNFFKDGHPIEVGKHFIQPEVAECMKRLSDNGWHDFYTGDIAKTIIKDMETRYGLLSQSDFSQIPLPIERQVLFGKYRQYGIHTFPPPGAGRVLMQVLNILEQFSYEDYNPDTPMGNLLLALAFQLTLRDRRRMPQNPDIYFQQIEEKMADKVYAKRVKKTIDSILNDYQNTLHTHDTPKTSGETTHFCVSDKDGNIVSVTQSIELVFGAKRVAKDLGFFYNNYMSAYDYKDRTHPYYLLPRNRPWSSAAPTIITYRNRPRLVLGSPGSERISTALAQVLIRYLDGKESLEAAIYAPRFHTSENKKLQLEIARFNEETITMFKALGFTLKNRDAFSFYLGCIQAIELPHMRNGRVHFGVADSRRDGDAIGLKDLSKHGENQ